MSQTQMKCRVIGYVMNLWSHHRGIVPLTLDDSEHL